MERWTFACDESGGFDSEERVALVLGGVLLPGGNDAPAHTQFWVELKALCHELGVHFPPHGTELRATHGAALRSIVSATSTWLASSGGVCIALVSRPAREQTDLARHVRMLGSLVDLAGRVAGGLGAEVLDLEVASRSFPLTDAEAAKARQDGLPVNRTEDGSSTLGIAAAEVREALESLQRTGAGPLGRWPARGSINVRSAFRSSSHVAVFVADLICNQIYATLRSRPDVSFAGLAEALLIEPARLLLGEAGRAHQVRRCDQALRLDPADWAAASRARTSLDTDLHRQNLGELKQFVAALAGSARTAEHIWHRATQRSLASAAREPAAAVRVLKQLAGSAQIDLDLKSGNYEATARALEHVWYGPAEHAARMRESCVDRELAARLWRLTLETANHRGDEVVAQLARRRFDEVLSSGVSLELLAETLRVRNLAVVSAQNALPSDAATAPARLLELEADARALEKLTRDTLELGTLLGISRSDDGVVAAASEHEVALREAAEYDGPHWEHADREHGRCLGTVARSLAFAGTLGEATHVLLRARARFGDSPSDLRFNASVLARVELERARVSPERARPRLLELALRLAGVDASFRHKVVPRLIPDDPSLRFTLDLLLRALLWCAECLPPPLCDAWLGEHAKAPQGGLYPVIDRQRSHPTELVARHAAELVARQGGPASAVQSWYELSLAVSDAAPEGTLRRLGAFTKALSEGNVGAGEPAGSLLNPTFEYR